MRKGRHMSNIHEECGVFGVISEKPANVAGICYYGLYALQHRGQESCGIVVNDDGLFVSRKDLGLVSEVFSGNALSSLPQGTMAVAHTRYGTTGGTSRSNCQPIEVNHQKGHMAIAHNGNLSNAAELRSALELSGAIFHTSSDTETIAYIVTKERLRAPSIEEALSRAMDILDGAYSLVMMSPKKLICARDPYGFRPLCYGRTKDGMYVAASESCALTAVGAEFIREVEPGEILIFSKDGIVSRREHCNQKKKTLCIFEYIYFSRPDSIVDGMSVHEFRKQTGKYLAKQSSVKADIVAGVPDSGLDAALGYAEESGIPYGMVFIKNKYIGRSFILNNQEKRQKAVALKLNPIRQNVEGKRIVLIDDSIVRGNTIKKTINRLREFGAKEIHLRIASPMFIDVCYFGTDIDKKDKLIANIKTKEEIRKNIGVESLEYLNIDNLKEIAKGSQMEDFCYGCFTGKYPIKVPKTLDKGVFEKIIF